MSLVYTLTLSLAGRVWRRATSRITIPSDSGDLPFTGGLEVAGFADPLGLFEEAPPRRSFAVAIQPRGNEPHVARLVEEGHPLESGVAEISVLSSGAAWESRTVLARGAPEETEYGDASEPIVFSVVADPQEGRLFPPADAIVSAQTWTSPPEESIGVSYPWVFGVPGAYRRSTGAAATGKGSRAVLVDTAGDSTPAYALLISMGKVAAVGESVTIEDVTASASGSKTVQLARDNLGRVVSVVALASGSGTLGIDDGSHDYYVDWSGTSGGVQSSRAARTLTGLGEVIEAILQGAGHTVDHGRFADAQANRLRVAGVIEVAVDPLSWVRDIARPLWPLVIAEGVGGLHPREYLPRRAPTASLEEGRNWRRLSGMETERGAVYSRRRLRFAYGRVQDLTFRSLWLSGSPGSPDLERGHHLARVSQQRYGLREGDELTSRIIYDEETADAVLRSWASTEALPWRIVKGQLPEELVGRVAPGDMVRLTDPGLYLSDAPALVDMIEYHPREIVATLRLADPIAYRAITGISGTGSSRRQR